MFTLFPRRCVKRNETRIAHIVLTVGTGAEAAAPVYTAVCTYTQTFVAREPLAEFAIKHVEAAVADVLFTPIAAKNTPSKVHEFALRASLKFEPRFLRVPCFFVGLFHEGIFGIKIPEGRLEHIIKRRLNELL